MDNRLTALFTEGRSVNIIGLRGSAPAFHLGRTAWLGQRSILCITPSETASQHLVQDMALFTDIPVFYFPGHEIPPYTPLSPDSGTVAERLATLFQIHSADKPFILVTSIEALQRRVLPRTSLANLAELVMRGEDTDLEGLIASLAACGYDAAALVQSVGEFSLRGGILDIFPSGFDMPVRLDFCGDTVESIRKFDPISQRSIGEMEEIVLLPVSDILYPADERGLQQ
ncbi:MAG: transcription-repair coupling factor, partial [Proteobacteria bacterium]|nr:transcription-repair coupling factor [Pseudomonadota bacterium]